MNMIVQDIMNRNVLTTAPDSTVQEAVELMNKSGVGSVIVVEEEKGMRGILTERDVMKLIEKGKDPKKTLVKEIMTSDVYFVKPEDDIIDAAELMISKQIKKLPVIKSGVLVGILTATDIVASEPKFMNQLGMLFMAQKGKQSAAG